ncbi:MAG: hypothetical protein ACO4B4_11520 [Planctomycetota bacterium]
MSAPRESERSLRRDSILTLLPSLAILLALALLPVGIAGCGGGDAGGDEAASSAGGEVDSELKEEAEEARSDAEKAKAKKYAKEDYEKALGYVERAEEFEEEGDAAKAKTYYRRAVKKFEEAAENAGRGAKKFERFEQKLAEYETNREAVKSAGTDALVPDLFSRAESTFASAREKFDEGNLDDAQKKLNLAMRDLDELKSRGQEAGRMRASADTERASMDRAREAATGEDAQTHAAQDWGYAEQLERDGNARYESQDFRAAQDFFVKARASYDDAARAARDAKAIASASARTADSGSAGSGDIPRGSQDYGEIDAGEIKIPDIGGLDVAMADLPGFFHGIAELGSGNTLSLSWSSGIEFKEDVNPFGTRHTGDPQKAHLLWEGMDGVGASDYVFAGNTEGIVMVNASFDSAAAIRATVQFQMVEPKGYFEIFLMAQDKSGGIDYYASQFGANILLVQENGRKRKPLASAAQAEYRKAPKDWVNRREPYEIVFQFIPSADDDEGTLECKINGETTAAFKSGTLTKGKIGFRWNRVKFYVESLDVRGVIDEEWAKAALQEKAQKEAAEADNPGGSLGF